MPNPGDVCPANDGGRLERIHVRDLVYCRTCDKGFDSKTGEAVVQVRGG